MQRTFSGSMQPRQQQQEVPGAVVPAAKAQQLMHAPKVSINTCSSDPHSSARSTRTFSHFPHHLQPQQQQQQQQSPPHSPQPFQLDQPAAAVASGAADSAGGNTARCLLSSFNDTEAPGPAADNSASAFEELMRSLAAATGATPSTAALEAPVAQVPAGSSKQQDKRSKLGIAKPPTAAAVGSAAEVAASAAAARAELAVLAASNKCKGIDSKLTPAAAAAAPEPSAAAGDGASDAAVMVRSAAVALMSADSSTAAAAAAGAQPAVLSSQPAKRQRKRQSAASPDPSQPSAAEITAVVDAPPVNKPQRRVRRKTAAAAAVDECQEAAAAAAEAAAAAKPKRQRKKYSSAAAAAGGEGGTDPVTEATTIAVGAAAAPAHAHATAKRQRKKSSSAAAAVHATDAKDPGAADAAEAAAAAPAPAKQRRQRRKTSREVARDDAADATDTVEGTAEAAVDAPAAKPKRQRRQRSTAAATSAAADGDSADPDFAPAAAAATKPVRRTKKVIAAEVQEAARQGLFGELTSLIGTYSHISMFNSSSNSQDWADLMGQAGSSTQQQQPGMLSGPAAAAAEIAAAAAGLISAVEPSSAAAEPGSTGGSSSESKQEQQQQQGGNISGSKSSSLALCRQSGLGGCRQQVWLHPVSSSQGIAASSQQQQQQQQQGLEASTKQDNQQQQQQQQGEISAAAAAGVPELKVLPNLGYACLCMTMRQYDVFNSRDCVKKTRDGPDGLAKVSQLALANARDLVPLLLWNEAHGIRLFRLSSCILPWMTSYEPEELPDWPDIQQALRAAGDVAKRLGHRLTFHPSEYCKIAGERAEWVTQSVKELEVHSRIFDEMGFLPASPYNKINIHVGGTYGGAKEVTLRRFSQVVNERLSPNCKARLTVENDDKASQYSVTDLMLVHRLTGIPIVCDLHHWKFCQGGQSQEEALHTAVTTWPAGVRPVVHWSESPEDPDKRRSAHSEYIDGPINLYGLEGQVDVMIESKAKELALLEYRQAVLEGWEVRPRARNSKHKVTAAANHLDELEEEITEGDEAAEEEKDE